MGSYLKFKIKRKLKNNFLEQIKTFQINMTYVHSTLLLPYTIDTRSYTVIFNRPLKATIHSTAFYDKSNLIGN